MAKNLCDKVSKIKNLKWQFRRIFRCRRRGIPHFFCKHYIHGEICKTKRCKMDATLKITKSVHFVLQISPRKHGLQKKWSTPRRRQRKILRNCHLNFLFLKLCHRDFLPQSNVINHNFSNRKVYQLFDKIMIFNITLWQKISVTKFKK